LGVFELLIINDEMADALRRSDASGFVKAAKHSKGYKPLVFSALQEAVKGVTSLEEVFRVAEQVEEETDEIVLTEAKPMATATEAGAQQSPAAIDEADVNIDDESVVAKQTDSESAVSQPASSDFVIPWREDD
jgi:MSHA biogenesis protein MshE